MGGRTAFKGLCGKEGNEGREGCEMRELVMDCILWSGEAAVHVGLTEEVSSAAVMESETFNGGEEVSRLQQPTDSYTGQ